MRTIRLNPFDARLAEVHRAVPPLLEQPMRALAGDRFIDAHGLFRGDTIPVWTDPIGHSTEAAVPKIVDAFWPRLEAAVSQRLARPVSRD